MCLSRIDSGEAAEEGVAVVTPSKSPSDKTSSIKIQIFAFRMEGQGVLRFLLLLLLGTFYFLELFGLGNL